MDETQPSPVLTGEHAECGGEGEHNSEGGDEAVGAVAVAAEPGHVTTHAGHHAAERVPPATANPSTPCSPVELIDRGLPLGTTGIRARGDLNGRTFTVMLWALQALLWGLATLAIAAYTGLVRKPF
ncbi:hypothetical protein [Amycolatopsis sp. CA-128772]|uniref:hypothetical protein n=1 Tax=Amycolatopsis sp. CA-128772 TaxID=2073159 RepID=UPI001E52AC1E|nr:hypothetical protein [Amycolatopsis sp. CA-128772]